MPVYKKHIVPWGKGAVGVKVACSNRYNRDNDSKPGFCRFWALTGTPAHKKCPSSRNQWTPFIGYRAERCFEVKVACSGKYNRDDEAGWDPSHPISPQLQAQCHAKSRRPISPLPPGCFTSASGSTDSRFNPIPEGSGQKVHFDDSDSMEETHSCRSRPMMRTTTRKRATMPIITTPRNIPRWSTLSM